jgi:WD40 repeat protein
MSLQPLTDPAIVLTGHRYPVQTIAFSPDGSTLATGDTAMNVRVWKGWEPLLTIDLHEEWDKVRPTERIRGAAFSRMGDRLFVAAGQRLMSFDLMHDGGTQGSEWTYVAPRFLGFLIVSPVALSVSRLDYVAAAFDSGSIGVWSINGSEGRTWHDNAAPRAMSYMPDGERLVGTDSFSVTLWDSIAQKRLDHMQSSDRIFGFAASPVDGIVAIRTLQDIRILRLDKRQLMGALPSGPGLPLLAFSPSGTLLAAATKSAVQFIDTTGRESFRIPLPDTRVVSMAFSPDGGRMAVGCADGTIRVWPIEG